MRRTLGWLGLSTAGVAACAPAGQEGPSALARDVADYAVRQYADSAVARLGDLIAFRTVAREGVPNVENPAFRELRDYLARVAEEFGLDFTDHGAVLIVGLGDASDRLGVLAHADVQPADSSKWRRSPFELDTLSEPGRLVARGAEDDKGPIAAALYAMRALMDRGVPLARRIELVVTLTEESDWEPIQAFVAQWDPPGINVALDSEYPVVTAEKAWNAVWLALPPDARAPAAREPRLVRFGGGAFLSQIPEDAVAVVAGSTPEVEAALRSAAERDSLVTFAFEAGGDSLVVRARGLAAHSSKPWQGRNAITHLAAVLGAREWPPTQAARMVRLVNALVGTGDYAERFGQIAHTHDFMGPLTLSLTTLGPGNADSLVAGINLRSPAGRTGAALDSLMRGAVAAWSAGTGTPVGVSTFVSEPYLVENAPHVPVLLDIFRHYSGQRDAQPIAIGGGTNARLLPYGVNFGPAMPGQEYTGHSEHEFMTREQFERNLRMYTAMLVELAASREP
jgi:dipeptidase D